MVKRLQRPRSPGWSALPESLQEDIASRLSAPDLVALALSARANLTLIEAMPLAAPEPPLRTRSAGHQGGAQLCTTATRTNPLTGLAALAAACQRPGDGDPATVRELMRRQGTASQALRQLPELLAHRHRLLDAWHHQPSVLDATRDVEAAAASLRFEQGQYRRQKWQAALLGISVLFNLPRVGLLTTAWYRRMQQSEVAERIYWSQSPLLALGGCLSGAYGALTAYQALPRMQRHLQDEGVELAGAEATLERATAPCNKLRNDTLSWAACAFLAARIERL